MQDDLAATVRLCIAMNMCIRLTKFQLVSEDGRIYSGIRCRCASNFLQGRHALQLGLGRGTLAWNLRLEYRPGASALQVWAVLDCRVTPAS